MNYKDYNEANIKLNINHPYINFYLIRMDTITMYHMSFMMNKPFVKLSYQT